MGVYDGKHMLYLITLHNKMLKINT